MGRKGSGSGLSGIRLLAVTVKQLVHTKQLLLLPITMFIGAEQAFIAVDFTAVRFFILNFLKNIYLKTLSVFLWLITYTVLCGLWLGNFTHRICYDLFWRGQCNCRRFCRWRCQINWTFADNVYNIRSSRCIIRVDAIMDCSRE